MDICAGNIVRSGAGRDKGRYMLALEVSEKFALVVDGKERKLCKPKRKNLKHLHPTKELADLENTKTDAAIRRLLWKWNYG